MPGSDHVRRNRAYWNDQAARYAGPGRRNWAQPDVDWGIWSIPESRVGMLPELDDCDAVELGCGTAYVSSWLARRGAHVVGIDNSPAQLHTARILQEEHDLRFPLLLGNAETLPFADASFDLALSEYGASIWCDPYRWIPEAARVLRSGGRLSFLVNSALYMLFAPDLDNVPAEDRLLRPYFGMHRFEWPDDDSVEFHLPHGEMFRLLRGTGFEVEALVELQAPRGATTPYPNVTADWAHRWPSEEVWIARRR